jgi:hypothetical protein
MTTKTMICPTCGQIGDYTERTNSHCAWLPSYADEDGNGFENYETTDWSFDCKHCGHSDGETGTY